MTEWRAASLSLPDTPARSPLHLEASTLSAEPRVHAAACLLIAASVSFREGLAVSFGDAAVSVADPDLAMFVADPDLVMFVADPDLVMFVADPDLVMFVADPDLGVTAGLTFGTRRPSRSAASRDREWSASDRFLNRRTFPASPFSERRRHARAPPVCAFCRRIGIGFPGVIMCGSLYPSTIICMIFSFAVIGIGGK